MSGSERAEAREIAIESAIVNCPNATADLSWNVYDLEGSSGSVESQRAAAAAGGGNRREHVGETTSVGGLCGAALCCKPVTNFDKRVEAEVKKCIVALTSRRMELEGAVRQLERSDATNSTYETTELLTSAKDTLRSFENDW